jgi:glycosyltransferase involved in cell wall biosynthesis
MKRRIAVWVYGGIGTGHFSQGYPALEKLLTRLTASFDIVIYSQFAPNPDFESRDFVIHSAPPKIKWGFLRWLFLIGYFLRDHRRSRYQLILAFWGFPAELIATLLSKMVSIPCAVYVLGSDVAGIPSINFGVLHRPFFRKLALWTYRKTSLLLTISEYQKANLKLFGITNAKVIPWGVEIERYIIRERKNCELIHFIHVGHFSLVKDQITLLKAFAIIQKKYPAELRLYGEDFLNGMLQRKCFELGIEANVKFMGMIPYAEMPDQYQWADVMLHTSLSEGQSMALTEGAASGVLLAGTNVGLLFDLGENGGIAVPVGDFQSLARQVIFLLENENLFRAKTHFARKWTEEHSIEWTASEVTANLKALMKGVESTEK